jgi:hypothetical protein
MRPWLYSAFKGEKEGLLRTKSYWNFIQLKTHMGVERVFGILKGQWKILFIIPNVVLAYIWVPPC